MSLFSNFTVTVTEISFKDKFREIIHTNNVIDKNILSEWGWGIIVDYCIAILNSQLVIKSCLAAKEIEGI